MDEEFDFLRPSKVYFLETNLSSPVLDVEIEATRLLVLDHRKWITVASKRHEMGRYRQSELDFFRKLCKVRDWKSYDLVKLPSLDPREYKTIEAEFLCSTGSRGKHYAQAQAIAKQIEKAVADGLERRGIPRSSIEGTAERLGSERSLPYRDAYEEFCNFYGRAESRTKTSEMMWTLGAVGGVKMWITSRYAFLEYSGGLRVSSPNQILMLKDKLATRYMMLEHVGPLRLDSSLTGSLISLFNWQDDTLEKYGNEAYELLKAIEPLFKTRLSHVTDDTFGDDTAYTRMKEKMLQKERKVCAIAKTDVSQIPALFKLVESVQGLDSIVEMFGCQKSCGHPIIDARRGGLSAAAEARSPDTTSLIDAQDLRNVFCHIILVTYIGKKGEWPPLKYLKKGTKLQLLNGRQERALTYHSYPLSDWTFVEWMKMFEMDYFPNFLELMDDKAISFYRSQKHLSWDEGNPSSQRRLLLEVLRRPEINIKEIVDRVSRRDIPFDWKIISLYPKEREFKLDPRMFAMMVLEMRCFFTCIEANIAENVFRYMPQQTMTKTKTQIQERFLAFTDPDRDSNSHTLFLEIDLSRWNLRWREMTVHMIGHDLNNMFGSPGTFTVTHWFFKQCQLMVRVSGLRPDGIEQEFPPTTSLAWPDHYGGLEGINQKAWTATTYAMIEKALIPFLLEGRISNYELIGQGDNQVLRLSVPKSEKTKSEILTLLRDDVNNSLETVCLSVNQVVKPEENIESTTVLTYSKDVYIKGVEYPTTLKKHSRLFPVTSSDFPSTTANAAAIMAGAVAGAENSRHSLCSAVVGWYHTARYLLAASDGYSIHGSQAVKMTARDIIGALILPPSIGGLIGTPIASFLYKGGSDPLGKEVSSIRLIADSPSEVGLIAGRALRGLQDRYCFNPTPSLDTLIDNPYGLPLDKATSPLGQVSHLTLDAFAGKVVNKDIRPLLEKAVVASEEKLKADILAVRPLNPILAHDLFEASGFGTIKLMRKMFLNTRTVQSIAQWVNPNITHNFLRADLNDISWFIAWLRGLPKLSYSTDNSYDICVSARSAWGLNLSGVSNYQPLDAYHSAGTTRNPSSIKWSSHSAVDLLFTRGPLSGYLGTATRDKRSEHGYKIVDAGAPSRAMMKLQLIRSQANGNPEFNELLDRIGLTRTNCKLSWITDILQKVIGGSLVHKFVSVMRHMAASYVGPLNFVTHIRLDTDSLGKVSGGSDNYSIMTQEFMVLCLSIAKLTHLHSGARCGELIVDTTSMIPVPDDSLKANPPTFESASLPRTRLLYIPDLILTRSYDTTARDIPRGAVVSPNRYSDPLVIQDGFVAFFCELLRDHHRAKILSDTRGLAALPAKLQIDIAEAHAVGPEKLCYYAAQAIWISNLRDTFRTLHLHPDRWDEALYLTHNISTCVKAMSNYIRHPLCYTHPDFEKMKGSTLKYAGSFSTQKRVEARVKRKLVQIYQDENHVFWKSKVPVFSSESAMTIVESVCVSAIKLLYPLFMTGNRKARLFGNLLASYSRLPSTTLSNPTLQLEALRMRLTQVAHIYKKEGDFLLSKGMVDIAHLKGVSVYNDSCQAIMRYARNITVSNGIVRPQKPRRTGAPPCHRQDVCERCIPLPSSRLTAMWNKYKPRINGGLTTAGYTWAPYIGSMRVVKNVMIVGSGNGGLADLLITAYGCSVTGIDLERDMPTESATLLNYVPIGVSQENSSNYTQSDLSISTSGDWFDPEVRKEILDSVNCASALFIDITSEGAPILSTLDDVMNTEMVDTVCARVIGNHEDILSGVSKLSEDYFARCWLVSRSYHTSEIIIEVRKRGERFLHVCGTPLLGHQLIMPETHNMIPPRREELLDAATCSSVSFRDCEDIHQVRVEINSLCNSLLNKPRTRQLLYKDRMALVWAHITVEAVFNPDPVKLIQEWISDEMVETDMLKYAMRDSLLSHLVRYVPRVRSAFL